MKEAYSKLLSKKVSQYVIDLQKGFTLIELLVVIALVGVLAVGIMTIINPVEQFQKGTDSKRKTDLVNIQKALELYYQDNGFYPDSSVDATIEGIPWGSGSFAPYLTKMPADPSDDKSYTYISDGQAYWLFASLDRWKNDTSVCVPGQTVESACSAAQGRSCGSGLCNYGVSSPNVSVQ